MKPARERDSGRGVLPASQRRRLVRAARAALRRAYAPYSRFRVGAAILTERGMVHTGCNVENSSYGLTNCAERNAIQSAVTKEGKELRIRAVAVANGKDLPCAPCGACRQVIFEFGPEAMVLYKTAAGWKERAISELLPDSFRL